MPIIDSANCSCDRCGVVGNHPWLSLPEGWIYDPKWLAERDGPPRFFCPNCQPGMMGTPEVGS